MSEIKKNKTSSNFIFYTGYQILIYLVPFIISPFLTRTLREDALGIFNFSNSIAIYFVLLANVGIAKYGQREISSSKENKSEAFWSLFFNHLIFSFLSITVFSILLFTVFKSQIGVYSFCLIYILSALFDVSWLFYGMENFKIVTVVNGIFALIKMAFVFILIRNPDHLFIYQLLYYGAFLLSNIVIFGIAVKHMGRPCFSIKGSLRHLKPLLFFSLTVVAVTLYTVFDKTLIGIFLNTTEVAYYEYADKIIGIPKMLILTIGTVLFPKMCTLESNDDQAKISQIHKISLFFAIGLSIGIIFGLFALGKPFLTYYYGENFSKSGEYVVYMAPIILFVTLGDIFRTQFIIPKKKDAFYLISVSLNAVVNLALSLALIRKLGVYGPIIGTLVAEAFGCTLQIIYCRKFTNVKKILDYLICFVLFGFLMFIVIRGFSNVIMLDGFWKIIVLFVIGVLFYMPIFGVLFLRERRLQWR